MGYHSSDVASNPYEAGEFALVSLVGTTFRAYAATEQNTAQKPKVGFRPCCTRATRVADPPAYALGEYQSLKARGLALRRRFGPWASRRLAAAQFARSFGNLPPRWDWAAGSSLAPVSI